MKITWDHYRTWLGDVLVSGLTLSGDAPLPARFATDTRTLRAGEWFVPLRGETFDGHGFLRDALERGAAGYLYEPSHHMPAAGARAIAVTDTLGALQRIAAGWRREMTALRLVALTGSSGKTTARAMTAGIFEKAGPTLTSPGNYNNEIGVPLTLVALDERHEYAVLELAARHEGDIAFLTGLVTPTVACCLNVGTAHAGEFGSLEALVRTKLEIFRRAPVDAVRVVTEDDPRLRYAAAEGGARVVSFGRGDGASVRVLETESRGLDGQLVRLALPGAVVAIDLATPHAAAPVNAAAAAAMALAAGADVAHVQAGLAGFAGLPGRFRVLRSGTRRIIDDTYNANPESMRAGIETLPGGTALVLGDMRELGSMSESAHTEAGAFAASRVDPALLVTVGPLARGIAAGALAAGLPRERIAAFEDVAALLEGWPAPLDEAPVVFVKGSRAVGLEQVLPRLVPGDEDLA